MGSLEEPARLEQGVGAGSCSNERDHWSIIGSTSGCPAAARGSRPGWFAVVGDGCCEEEQIEYELGSEEQVEYELVSGDAAHEDV